MDKPAAILNRSNQNPTQVYAVELIPREVFLGSHCRNLRRRNLKCGQPRIHSHFAKTHFKVAFIAPFALKKIHKQHRNLNFTAGKGAFGRCCNLVDFWNKTLALINKIMEINLPRDPIILLLSYLKDAVPKEQQEQTVNLLMGGNVLSAQYWKNNKKQGINKWLYKIWDVAKAMKLTYCVRVCEG